MGAINDFMNGGKSALLTLVVCMFPAGAVLLPGLPSAPEFTPLSGDGREEAVVASIDLDALVTDKDVVAESKEPTAAPAIEALADATLPQSTEPTPQVAQPLPGIVKTDKPVATPAPSRAASLREEAKRKGATRAAQAQAKRERAEQIAKASTAAKMAGKGKGKANNKCVHHDDRITKVGDHTYTIEKSLVDHYTSSVANASKLAAVAWHDKGFRIWKMGCKNPLRLAGLRNQDVIHSINGKQIRTALQATAAWKRLKSKKQVEIVFFRKGKRHTMTYRVS